MDHAAVVTALPTAYLVMTPGVVIALLALRVEDVA